MSEAKTHRIGEFEFRFTPDGDTHQGTLITRHPDMQHPYEAEVHLRKVRSRNEYVKDAAETLALENESEAVRSFKAALNELSVRLTEDEAAREAAAEEEEQPSEPDCSEAPPEVAEEEIEERVGRPRVLVRFVEDAASFSRVVGEREQLKLLTLVALSAQLDLLPNDKPMAANAVVTAGAGRGKNHLCDAVTVPMPKGFYLAFESSSAKAFYYMAERNAAFLKHRFVYPNEAEGVDQLVEMLRPLLSGGKARHNTVNKDARGRNVHQEFVIERPVALAIPTVRNKLDTQLQTRMLVMELEDYKGRVAAHSRAVSGLLSPEYAGADFAGQIRAWQAALLSLTGVRRVVLPVDRDEFCLSSDEVSHGARLWANLMGLMCAHAWLEQRNREVMTLPNGEQRAIVATPEDYEAAYDVFKATCERSVKNISPTHRKILDALYELKKEDELQPSWAMRENSWSQREIERRTGVPQSTISGQKTYLTKSLKLVVEITSGKLSLAEDVDPSLWNTDDALDGFPRPEQVRSWWEGNDGPPDPETPGRTGRGRPQLAEGREDGEKGDRGTPGRDPEAPGRVAADDGGVRADRPGDAGDRQAPGRENALDERQDVPESAPTGATGGFEDREGENGGEGEGSAGAVGEDHGDHYRREKEARLGPGWESRPAGAILGQLGWAKSEGTVGEERGKGDARPINADGDPVAQEIRESIVYSAYEGPHTSYAATPRGLFELVERREGWGYPRPSWWPADPTEMQGHLSGLAPALRDKGIVAEYWEKEGAAREGAGGGFWVFAPAGDGRPTNEDMEECAWIRAAYFEGMGEPELFDEIE